MLYAYDASGLRTSVGGSLAPGNLEAATSQPNGFDANARQTAANGATITYDADGNMTSDGTRTFTWNGRGQLTKVSVGDSVVTSYTYDALGRRRTMTAGADTTSFDYDNIDVVAERKGSDLAPVLTGPWHGRALCTREGRPAQLPIDGCNGVDRGYNRSGGIHHTAL
jgi:YD repeat-containing protein